MKKWELSGVNCQVGIDSVYQLKKSYVDEIFYLHKKSNNELVYPHSFSFLLVLFLLEFPYQLDGYQINTCTEKMNCNGYHYAPFAKLSGIRNSQPEGYKVRMGLYVQGPHDGHILLSSSPNTDSVYEIGKFCLKVKFHFMKHIKLISNLSFISSLQCLAVGAIQ